MKTMHFNFTQITLVLPLLNFHRFNKSKEQKMQTNRKHKVKEAETSPDI